MELSRSVNHLPVVTRQGVYLGRVVGIEVDDSGYHVLFYRVGRWGIWFFRKILLISPRQVIKITNQQMVVDDLLVNESASKTTLNPVQS